VAILIEGGRLVTEIDSYGASILVDGDRISKIGRRIEAPASAEVYDATGKLVLPGVIDAHVHVALNLCGHTSSGFEATTRAAAFGGVTSILTYATPRKGELLAEAVESRKAEADGRCYIDYGLHATLARWDDREEDEIPAMIDAGIPSFKMYTTYSAAGLKSDDEEFYRALLLVGQQGGLVEAHCENDWIIDRKVRRLVDEGRLLPTDHAASRPSYVEGEAVGSVLRAAYDAGAPVYIVHVSTAEGLEAIAEGDDLGVEVYCETCPHFLLLDEASLAGEGGQRFATCPPVRPKVHQARLWEGLEDGTIQVVATDHAEFLAADKDAGVSDFRDIPMGLPGVGTLLPLMWQHGVNEGRMSENELVDRLSTNPAEIFGLYPRKGSLSEGADADLVIFDPNLEVAISPGGLHGHSDYSPYDGWEVHGWPVSTMVRGNWVVKDRELVGSREFGSFIHRGKVCQRPGNRGV
jgi:dihydropyrimidinase